ncbi:hypothetical protein DICSQDRAFT_132674 [Dichomitus squalens LYAD-421 SS1]|nr:uncharacterized protein DICSQDRAFT_132674 [Dichomitus squalens LYAD-421 SS1]EJF65140.1 hypothetical protein DICSQDRAFT_132674 [Dichomitus squalens LYAD-421 SS1]TBU29530.1 hypothetical protein BD311DRAFT_660846 [Dichomitus squalens]
MNLARPWGPPFHSHIFQASSAGNGKTPDARARIAHNIHASSGANPARPSAIPSWDR